MSEWTDLSVDVETSGTRPDRAAIIQIGAVKFNYDTSEVCHDFFDRALEMMPHRSWEEDTRAFWSKHPTVYQGIVARAEDPVLVLKDFAEWAKPSSKGPLRLWAKPISFEWPFLESHFHDSGVRSPFHYRNCVDLTSFVAGWRHTVDYQKTSELMRSLPFSGDVHNALHDALNQLTVALTFAKEHNS